MSADLDTRPEALLRRLLRHFYCGHDGLEWSYRDGCDVGDAEGYDFEAALLPYLSDEKAAGLRDIWARREKRAAAAAAAAAALPRIGQVVRYRASAFDPTSIAEGVAGKVCTARVVEVGECAALGPGIWATVLPLHRCIPGALFPGQRRNVAAADLLPFEDETKTPTQPTKGSA